jgi:ergothioneine biosynthesis protein EgtB
VAPLAAALRAARADTLRVFDAYRRALPALQVPRRPELNPPLWELGHIGWFQEWWIARNPERALGLAADPDVPRACGVRAGADALYHSSRVAHARRWSLPLPDAAATLDDLSRQLEAALALLPAAHDADDRALYFHRLALLHEDMHHEAALYMAQTLAIDLDDERWRPRPDPSPRRELGLGRAAVTLGRPASSPGFAFDNEIGAETVLLEPFAIDSRPVSWGEFLPFVEQGGYRQTRGWSAARLAWRVRQPVEHPAVLRRHGARWQRRLGSRWLPLDPDQPACHLTQHEAEAWCAWAGRRLPREAEWEHAALERPDDFVRGNVWEWTASLFRPFPGFTAHPYRDYSAPWFDGRPVLRGASFATQPRIRHLHYRNYFGAERCDLPAGFRSCTG